MRSTTLTLLLALVASALVLGACAKRNEVPLSANLSEDDDTYCRAGGKITPGSPEYVNCIRNRDAQFKMASQVIASITSIVAAKKAANR